MSDTNNNRTKTVFEVDNIEGELEDLRSVLKINGYPKKFIDTATSKHDSAYEKSPNTSLLSVYHIQYWFSLKQNRKDFDGSWHTGIPF